MRGPLVVKTTIWTLVDHYLDPFGPLFGPILDPVLDPFALFWPIISPKPDPLLTHYGTIIGPFLDPFLIISGPQPILLEFGKVRFPENEVFEVSAVVNQ